MWKLGSEKQSAFLKVTQVCCARRDYIPCLYSS